jgi:predicted lactoylglutathione lyase
MSEPNAINFHPASPILRVQDLDASIDYYTDALGFTIDWQDSGVMASVARGACHIMLAQGDQGNPGSWVYIGIGDVDVLYAEYKTTGAKIRHEPTNYWWAYEMQVEDLDGNVLRIGSANRKDMPFGEWLDMNGNLWR